jgi:RND family efflux transporter MFP subunit
MNRAGPATAPPPTGLSTRRVAAVLLGVGLLFVMLYAVGLVPRLREQRRLAAEARAERERLPQVSTTQPHPAPAVVDLPLPGNIQAILETGIYARTDGYLKARRVDIGSHVENGELLAEIDTPEVDAQLNQALANLNEAKANVVKLEADLALARTTLQRYQQAGAGTVSKQQIDEKTASVTTAEKAVDAARATVSANEANVQRLLDLKGYQKVYAPFDGIITARNVDPGALISGGAGAGVHELFRLAQVDMLRIFVYVPQSSAPDIKVGQSAAVSVREYPRRVFEGRVSRTAGAIDPTSRTMLVEVLVPNPDNALFAGGYATVRFKIERGEPPLLIPTNALLVDAVGVRVAVVTADNTLHYRPIDIGRDYGDEVEVLSGVDQGDVLATGLNGSLPDGAAVMVAPSGPTRTAAAVEHNANVPAGR